jgi:RND family efflux transporter MFP subunit
LRLIVLPGGGDLARVQEEATAAEARVENARSKARRAAELLREGVGSEAEHEDAQTELASAEAAWVAARARLELLQSGTVSTDISDLSPITLQAPESGFVHGVTFAVGQTVSAGAPLMEIAKHNPLWVRVPVYVGDVGTVDRSAAASVVLPGDPPGTPGRDALPIEGPPTADPTTASADLFFRMDNSDDRFRPGQRVSVSIALQSEGEQLSVPWAAVLHDVYGGTWVYESLGEFAYARRRVEVLDVVDGMAVLRRGPEPGTPVVVVGAAELYSTEFGISH